RDPHAHRGRDRRGAARDDHRALRPPARDPARRGAAPGRGRLRRDRHAVRARASPSVSERAALVAGWGAYVPERVVTNADLERALVTTDAWITTRTGIRERRWADPGTSTGDMAVHAGRAALRTAGLDRGDPVVLATTAPDPPCPATAPWVAHRLGLGTVPAHDVGAVCSGFVYALASARDAILAGSADSVLVVGADRFSG